MEATRDFDQKLSEIVMIIFILISQTEIIVGIAVFSLNVYCIWVDVSSIEENWNTVVN
jgi:hypothetical protein